MKLVSPTIYAFVAALSIAALACGAATSPDKVAHGPPPPPPPAPPKEILVEKAKEEGALKDLAASDADADGAADEFEPEKVSLGGLPGAPPPTERAMDSMAPPPKAIALPARSKGASQSAGHGSTGGTGGTVGAATEVRGSLDKEEIRRVVRAHLNDVKRCYEQGLTRRPDLEGRVTVKFTIGKTGTVLTAVVQETTLNDRQVEVCITGAVTRWTFPKPAGDGNVVISYPFLLKAGS